MIFPKNDGGLVDLAVPRSTWKQSQKRMPTTFQTFVNEIPAALPVIQNDQFRSDLKLATAVQRHMLPRNYRQLPTIRYAGTSRAASGIGGDYYDFLDLGPSLLGVLL